MIKKCLYCKKEFKTDRKGKRCCSRECSSNLKKQVNVTRNKTICQKYLNGNSSCELSKEYKLTRTQISRILKEYNIETRSNKINSRKYNVNEHYFDVIDTEDKAYWLGFLYADGYISKTNSMKLGLTISEKDYNHLIKYNKCLESNYPIKHYIGTTYNSSTRYIRTIFTSESLVSAVEKLGVVDHKTLILKEPTRKQVPDELIRHFARGYFDGDGSFSKNSNHFILPYNIKICGTAEIIHFFQRIFNVQGSIEKRHDDDKNNYQLSFGGTEEVIHIANYMYKDSTVYLDRKYKRYLELLEQYSRLSEKSVRL